MGKLSAMTGGLAAGLLAAQAWAAPPPPAGVTVSELVIEASKTVSELTVTAKPKCLKPQVGAMNPTRPKVVDVFPARGAVVRPGLLVVRVTFDQPMACEGRLDPDPPLADPCPGILHDMLLSYDRKTVRTVCMVEPGTKYGFAVGQDPNAPTFVGVAGLPVVSAKIGFETSAGPLVTDVCQALGEDSRTAQEMKRSGKTCGG
jgi:hypothetical protein